MDDKFRQKVQLLISVLTVATLVLGVWITARLAPLAQNIAVNDTRIKALESKGETYVTQSEYIATLKGIDQRLSGIETLLKDRINSK